MRKHYESFSLKEKHSGSDHGSCFSSPTKFRLLLWAGVSALSLNVAEVSAEKVPPANPSETATSTTKLEGGTKQDKVSEGIAQVGPQKPMPPQNISVVEDKNTNLKTAEVNQRTETSIQTAEDNKGTKTSTQKTTQVHQITEVSTQTSLGNQASGPSAPTPSGDQASGPSAPTLPVDQAAGPSAPTLPVDQAAGPSAPTPSGNQAAGTPAPTLPGDQASGPPAPTLPVDQASGPPAPTLPVDQASRPSAPTPSGDQGTVTPAPTPSGNQASGPSAPIPPGDQASRPSAPTPSGDQASGPSAPTPSGDQASGPSAPTPSGDQASGPSAPTPSGDKASGPSAPTPSGDKASGPSAPTPSGNQAAGTPAPTPSGDKASGPSAPTPSGDKASGPSAPTLPVDQAAGPSAPTPSGDKASGPSAPTLPVDQAAGPSAPTPSGDKASGTPAPTPSGNQAARTPAPTPSGNQAAGTPAPTPSGDKASGSSPQITEGNKGKNAPNPTIAGNNDNAGPVQAPSAPNPSLVDKVNKVNPPADLSLPSPDPREELLPLYYAAASSLRTTAFALYGNYAERMGLIGFLQRREYEKNSAYPKKGVGSQSDRNSSGLLVVPRRVAGWGRWLGQEESLSHRVKEDSETLASQTKHRLSGVQVGVNLTESETSWGTTVVGVSVSYGYNGTKITRPMEDKENSKEKSTEDRSQKMHLEAFAGTIHVTHFFNPALYADLGLMGLTYWGHLKSQTSLPNSLKWKGEGFLASAELGYRIALNSSLTVTPQMQFSHFYGNLDRTDEKTKDSFLHNVGFKKVPQTQLRLGAIASGNFAMGQESRLLPYVSVDYIQNFRSNSPSILDNSPFKLGESSPFNVPESSPSLIQVGVGVSFEIQENFMLFAYGRYRKTIEHAERERGHARAAGVGLNYTF